MDSVRCVEIYTHKILNMLIEKVISDISEIYVIHFVVDDGGGGGACEVWKEYVERCQLLYNC